MRLGPIQSWRRLGRVFEPGGQRPWLHSHAACPTPLVLDDRTVRVYFSPRDAQGRSCIASLDLAIDGVRYEVLQIGEEPLLAAGSPGSFDDSGVTIGSVVQVGSELHAYYLGWSLGVTVPYRNFIGLARGLLHGAAWRRQLSVPVLDRNAEDPCTLSYPWVTQGPEGWTMWYGSQLGWGEPREMSHVLRRAHSDDGIAWRRDGVDAMPAESGPGIGLARPCVLAGNGAFRMWYSKRTIGRLAYATGYAESTDGRCWQPVPQALRLLGAPQPWELDETAYACVFRLHGRLYMLYNGTGYGKSGFGLALLEDDPT